MITQGAVSNGLTYELQLHSQPTDKLLGRWKGLTLVWVDGAADKANITDAKKARG